MRKVTVTATTHPSLHPAELPTSSPPNPGGPGPWLSPGHPGDLAPSVLATRCSTGGCRFGWVSPVAVPPEWGLTTCSLRRRAPRTHCRSRPGACRSAAAGSLRGKQRGQRPGLGLGLGTSLRPPHDATLTAGVTETAPHPHLESGKSPTPIAGDPETAPHHGCAETALFLSFPDIASLTPGHTQALSHAWEVRDPHHFEAAPSVPRGGERARAEEQGGRGGRRGGHSGHTGCLALL